MLLTRPGCIQGKHTQREQNQEYDRAWSYRAQYFNLDWKKIPQPALLHYKKEVVGGCCKNIQGTSCNSGKCSLMNADNASSTLVTTLVPNESKCNQCTSFIRACAIENATNIHQLHPSRSNCIDLYNRFL